MPCRRSARRLRPHPAPHDCLRPCSPRTSPHLRELTRKLPGRGREGEPAGPASLSVRRGVSAGAMTSLTQRSSGLVQRRTEASRNAADKERAAGGGGGSGEDEAQSRRDEQDDDDKGDSKETRLTLMEEVLLLGLKDREVRARRAGWGRGGERAPGGPRWAPAEAAPAPGSGAPRPRAPDLSRGRWESALSSEAPCVPDAPGPECLDFSSLHTLVSEPWHSLHFFFAFFRK